MLKSENGTCSVNAVTDTRLSESETYVVGQLDLVAGTWRWNPKWEASEKHWLKCGEVIPENARCPICGER